MRRAFLLACLICSGLAITTATATAAPAGPSPADVQALNAQIPPDVLAASQASVAAQAANAPALPCNPDPTLVSQLTFLEPNVSAKNLAAYQKLLTDATNAGPGPNPALAPNLKGLNDYLNFFANEGAVPASLRSEVQDVQDDFNYQAGNSAEQGTGGLVAQDPGNCLPVNGNNNEASNTPAGSAPSTGFLPPASGTAVTTAATPAPTTTDTTTTTADTLSAPTTTDTTTTDTTTLTPDQAATQAQLDAQLKAEINAAYGGVDVYDLLENAGGVQPQPDAPVSAGVAALKAIDGPGANLGAGTINPSPPPAISVNGRTLTAVNLGGLPDAANWSVYDGLISWQICPTALPGNDFDAICQFAPGNSSDSTYTATQPGQYRLAVNLIYSGSRRDLLSADGYSATVSVP